MSAKRSQTPDFRKIDTKRRMELLQKAHEVLLERKSQMKGQEPWMEPEKPQEYRVDVETSNFSLQNVEDLNDNDKMLIGNYQNMVYAPTDKIEVQSPNKNLVDNKEGSKVKEDDLVTKNRLYCDIERIISVQVNAAMSECSRRIFENKEQLSFLQKENELLKSQVHHFDKLFMRRRDEDEELRSEFFDFRNQMKEHQQRIYNSERLLGLLEIEKYQRIIKKIESCRPRWIYDPNILDEDLEMIGMLRKEYESIDLFGHEWNLINDMKKVVDLNAIQKYLSLIDKIETLNPSKDEFATGIECIKKLIVIVPFDKMKILLSLIGRFKYIEDMEEEMNLFEAIKHRMSPFSIARNFTSNDSLEVLDHFLPLDGEFQDSRYSIGGNEDANKSDSAISNKSDIENVPSEFYHLRYNDNHLNIQHLENDEKVQIEKMIQMANEKIRVTFCKTHPRPNHNPSIGNIFKNLKDLRMEIKNLYELSLKLI